MTFASPFFNTKNTPPGALLPSAAAAFSFWNSLSPLILSPRYAPGSPVAGTRNHFQFPVGHHMNSNHSPGAGSGVGVMPSSSNLNALGYSLSPLLGSRAFSPFEPQVLFPSSSGSKSISVLQ